jgi:hypothetical protein
VLRNYHYEWDEEKRVFSNMPAHDWSSHGSSAFRTLALSWKHPVGVKPGDTQAQIIERIAAGSVGNQTFGKLKEAHLRKMKNLRQGLYH